MLASRVPRPAPSPVQDSLDHVAIRRKRVSPRRGKPRHPIWSAAAKPPLWLSAVRPRASQSGVVAPLGLATAVHAVPCGDPQNARRSGICRRHPFGTCPTLCPGSKEMSGKYARPIHERLPDVKGCHWPFFFVFRPIPRLDPPRSAREPPQAGHAFRDDLLLRLLDRAPEEGSFRPSYSFVNRCLWGADAPPGPHGLVRCGRPIYNEA